VKGKLMWLGTLHLPGNTVSAQQCSIKEAQYLYRSAIFIVVAVSIIAGKLMWQGTLHSPGNTILVQQCSIKETQYLCRSAVFIVFVALIIAGKLMWQGTLHLAGNTVVVYWHGVPFVLHSALDYRAPNVTSVVPAIGSISSCNR